MSFAHSINYSYDAVGNFTRKTDYSLDSADAYQYVSNTNRVSSVELASGGTVEFGYDNKGNQTHRNNIQEITYNTFNKPTAINRLGSSVALFYGSDLMRYKQVRNVNGKTTTTYYINKLFEVEHADNKVTERSYISDIAILEESESNYSITFTHRDRLGSAVTFTDHNGKIVAFRSFDPFGKPKMGDGSLISSMGMRARLSNNMTDIAQATRKGFTDHEHLDEVELIHMNGRVYDYNLGRFLSVDPFIQGVGNSQGINPYSYVMNNPLGYTDPTGYSAVETEEVKKVSTGSRIAKRTGETKQTATVTSNGVSTTVTKTTKSNGSSSYTSTSNGGGRSKTFAGDIGSQQQIAKNDSTNVGGADNRYLTASTDDEQLHWGGKPTDGPKTTKTTTELETDVEFEGTLETLRATKYELQTTPSANLPDFTKTGGLPVGPGMDVAIDWNNYDVTFQVYSLYEVTTTKTSWSRETVAISSITGQKIKYHNKVSSPPKVVRTSLGRYWTIKGKTGQKVGTMKFPLPVPIPTR